MLALNAPLHVGQVLKPRKGSRIPACRIVRWSSCSSGGIEWILQPIGSEVEYGLSLSEIFACFVFDDE